MPQSPYAVGERLQRLGLAWNVVKIAPERQGEFGQHLPRIIRREMANQRRLAMKRGTMVRSKAVRSREDGASAPVARILWNPPAAEPQGRASGRCLGATFSNQNVTQK